MYNALSHELPDFSEKNWTSELRHHVPQFTPFTGISLADFVYSDSTGKLTEIIFKGQKRLIEAWRGRWPTFYLEVKTTGTGDKYAPFAFKRQQLLTVSLALFVIIFTHFISRLVCRHRKWPFVM